MVSPKTITVTDDAYRRLARLKRPKESFSEVIQRLTGREDLMRFAGTISAGFAKDLRKSVASTRRDFARRLKGRI